MPGTLYIVATPLGNLEDLSPRALGNLRSVECIACEDTRRTARLLQRFDVKTRMLSCHKFNESARLEAVLGILQDGGDVALVSDGGTPGVSDPGMLLVQAAWNDGIRVSPLPGPSAVVTLLSASGMPADRFRFDGFLPHRQGQRRRRLRELASDPMTLVFFEAPHRIRETLGDMEAILGGRSLVLGRELSKVHETLLRGTAREILDALGSGEVRGEITLVVEGAGRGPEWTAPDAGASRIVEVWEEALDAADGDRREALKSSARILGMKRAELYRILAELGKAD